jgi:hypothetical protein
MDRRDFFKTIFATPVFAPFLLSSQGSANDSLFLITDNPEAFLPAILQQARIRDRSFGQSFAVLDHHPRKTALSHALEEAGWTKASSIQTADLALSFRPLQHPSPPSFTAVKAGKILDIRTKGLFSLWKEMNGKHASSSCLTIATLQTENKSGRPGKSVHIYHGGHLLEETPLKKDRVLTLRGDRGHITVNIEQGKAFVSSSSCRHKICCSAPPVFVSGERIVCAPNHFLLEVRGGRGLVDTIIG